MNVLKKNLSKCWSYRLLVKCRKKYLINKDERDRDREKRVKWRGIDRERERVNGNIQN